MRYVCKNTPAKIVFPARDAAMIGAVYVFHRIYVKIRVLNRNSEGFFFSAVLFFNKFVTMNILLDLSFFNRISSLYD
jgi:hypothetical protein